MLRLRSEGRWHSDYCYGTQWDRHRVDCCMEWLYHTRMPCQEAEVVCSVVEVVLFPSDLRENMSNYWQQTSKNKKSPFVADEWDAMEMFCKMLKWFKRER